MVESSPVIREHALTWFVVGAQWKVMVDWLVRVQ